MGSPESRIGRPALFVLEPVRITLLSAAIALVVLVGVPYKHDRDARASAISMRRAEPSPDARWLAVEGLQGGEKRLWLVGLAQEALRELEAENQSFALDPWSEDGLLRVRELAPGASWDVRWIAPDSGDTVKITEEDAAHTQPAGASAPLWARIVRQNSTNQSVTSVVRWPAKSLSFELPTRSLTRHQVTRLPGVVFYSLREGGAVRVYRHDMAKDERRELLVLLKNRSNWSVAPDGQAIVADDASHTRVFSAEDGKAIAGPWKLSTDRRWIDDATSRHLLLGWEREFVVIDLVRDHQLPLASELEFDRLRALSDGRFLLEKAGVVRLLDEEARFERVVFPSDA